MKLNEIKDNAGATKNRTRVGRGIGSGKGKTCGSGQKGQKSRTGVAIKGFEGGQMPLYRRLPKRGFNNPNAREFAEINLGKLQEAVDSKKIDVKKPVTEQTLVEGGVITHLRDGVRILGNGELKAKLDITVTGASKGAVAGIEKAGGKITTTAVKKRTVADKRAAKAEKKAAATVKK